MSVQILTYVDLAAHLKISSEAARAPAKRLRLPRSRSQDGKAPVSVDLAEIRHTPRSPRDHQVLTGPLKPRIETLQVEIARLEATAAGHRADFGGERADQLMAELLKATAAAMSAKEATTRLEGELASLRADGRVSRLVQADKQTRRRPRTRCKPSSTASRGPGGRRS